MKIKKLMSGFLAIVLCLQLVTVNTFAVNIKPEDSSKITQIEKLSEDVLLQNIEVGIDNITNLPNILYASLENSELEESVYEKVITNAQIPLPLQLKTSYGVYFLTDIASNYVFTVLMIDDKYTLSSEVVLPQIRVNFMDK